MGLVSVEDGTLYSSLCCCLPAWFSLFSSLFSVCVCHIGVALLLDSRPAARDSLRVLGGSGIIFPVPWVGEVRQGPAWAAPCKSPQVPRYQEEAPPLPRTGDYLILRARVLIKLHGEGPSRYSPPDIRQTLRMGGGARVVLAWLMLAEE